MDNSGWFYVSLLLFGYALAATVFFRRDNSPVVVAPSQDPLRNNESIGKVIGGGLALVILFFFVVMAVLGNG